jgi:zinc-ribbon domain
MFCDRCGAPVQPAQRFCGACGKDLVATAAVPYPQMGRVQEHLRLVAIFWLVLSAFNLVGALVLWVLAHGLFPHLHEMGAPPEAPTAFLVSLFSMLALVVFVKALAGFLAGWGLLNREPWARMLTIVLSFLALLNVPFGTALGIYSLWVLLPSSSEAEYQQMVRTAGAS